MDDQFYDARYELAKRLEREAMEEDREREFERVREEVRGETGIRGSVPYEAQQIINATAKLRIFLDDFERRRKGGF